MFKLDVHTHTIASGHAYSTLLENVQYAKKAELSLLGVSDHAPAMPGSTYVFHFQNLKVIPKEIDGIRILKGVEANIIGYDGQLDMKSSDLKNLDYAIASLHPPCIAFGDRRTNTEMLLKVMENPYVKIIGHPDDGRYPLDYEAIVLGAKKMGKLLEVNNASLNPKGFRFNVHENVQEMLKLCRRYEVPVICNTDSHFALDIGRFDYCYEALREAGFPEELVINHRPKDFMEYCQIED